MKLILSFFLSIGLISCHKSNKDRGEHENFGKFAADVEYNILI